MLRLARFVITSVSRRMSVILRCLYRGGKRDRDKQSECTFQESRRGVEMFFQMLLRYTEGVQKFSRAERGKT